MADSDDGINVLLVSYPTQGHINTFVQFGKRLASPRPTAASGGAPSRRPGAFRVVPFSDGCDHGGYDEVGDAHAYLARLQSAGSRTLDEL